MANAVRVFAPGSVGNVGPGLDILGLAVTGLGDTVTAERSTQPGIEVLDPGHPALPTDPSRHTAAIAAGAVLRLAGAGQREGLRLRVVKGLPIEGGQGGSAASAVAGAVAANLLLGKPLGPGDLLLAALEAEAVVAGRHADNIAPILLGGMVLVRSLDPIDVVRIPTPPGLRVVLAHPDRQMPTREGRAVLPTQIDRETALYQAAQVAAIVAACASGDLALLGRAIDDRIAEPVRAPMLDGFREAKAAALAAGAAGCSISGSGPTVFALAGGTAAAERIGQAVAECYRSRGIPCAMRVERVDQQGARAV